MLKDDVDLSCNLITDGGFCIWEKLSFCLALGMIGQ